MGTTFNNVKELSHKDMNYEANYVSSSDTSSSDSSDYTEPVDGEIEEDDPNMVDVLDVDEVIQEEDDEGS